MSLLWDTSRLSGIVHKKYIICWRKSRFCHYHLLSECGYISSTNDCTLMMHIHRISIVNMLKLTKGQGQKVKGQGQTYKFVKQLIWLYTMNQWLDMDDTCSHDSYQWYVEVDLRSRSQGQRSRSNMQFCENIVLTIYHEPIIRDGWYLHTWLI